MTRDKPSNVTASVRQRLLNIIRETGDDANLVWTSYATERLLYRLSISEYAGEFILKGAMLFMAWTGRSYRPTILPYWTSRLQLYVRTHMRRSLPRNFRPLLRWESSIAE